jgi:hypothetical protein
MNISEESEKESKKVKKTQSLEKTLKEIEEMEEREIELKRSEKDSEFFHREKSRITRKMISGSRKIKEKMIEGEIDGCEWSYDTSSGSSLVVLEKGKSDNIQEGHVFKKVKSALSLKEKTPEKELAEVERRDSKKKKTESLKLKKGQEDLKIGEKDEVDIPPKSGLDHEKDENLREKLERMIATSNPLQHLEGKTFLGHDIFLKDELEDERTSSEGIVKIEGKFDSLKEKEEIQVTLSFYGMIVSFNSV